MDYAAHRPDGYQGKAGSHLAKIARDLRRTLWDMQRSFPHGTFRLPTEMLDELAGVLVDFAEDLHSGTGIWVAYERYNTEFFGTPLPMTSGKKGSRAGFHPDRFRHFLWVLYPVLLDGLVASPASQALQLIAEASSKLLSNAFSALPKDSSVKAFLGSSNRQGWDLKEKLVWLGTHSFLFRTLYARYMEETATEGSRLIPRTDDFVCQECTRWSGLGVIDILAEVLDISADDRRDLRSWYERHAAYYKILGGDDQFVQAINLVNGQSYCITIGMVNSPFRRGQIIFGSTVPWRRQWYWSGEQQFVGDAADVDVDELKNSMKRQSPGIVCRYSKEYEALVRERMAEMHEKMMAYQGKDLTVYPDGLSMAADWQKELRWQWDSRPQEEVKEAVEKHGLEKCRPEINLPNAMLEEKDGFGVFLNPDEGKEIMSHFTPLVSGLKKKGDGLTEDEEESIRGFIESDAISPKFVRRVLTEHGDESVRAAFLLKGDLPDYWLDYLLRSCKGPFYRKRYPALSVV